MLNKKKGILKKCTTMTLITSIIITGLQGIGSLYNVQHVQAVTSEASNASTSAMTKEKQIKNIIYMIPDGGGFPAYDLTKIVKEAGGLTYKYQDENFTGTKPTANKMYMDEYLYGSVETKSANNEVTDSAAAGTALATGKKTNNNYIGITSNGKPIANILELAQLEGKSTGVIATSYQYDATPSSFLAHNSTRSNNDALIEQLKYSDVNVLIGGGLNYSGYTSKNNTSAIKEMGYTVVNTEDELKAAASNATAGVKICGAFQETAHHMPYDFGYGSSYDGINDSAKKTPTLAEMTQYSIDALEEDEDGFFLMVEGSKVDYGCHHGLGTEIVSEYLAFDEAFKVALDYAKKRTDTMIVVTPDHNTGISVLPSGDKLKNAVSKIQNGNNPTDGFIFTSSNKEYPHSSANVGIWMYLPEGVETISGLSDSPITTTEDRNKYVIDNTDIAPYLASLISNQTLQDATDTLYIDVTNQGNYKDGVFTFNEKNASVTINTDQAIVNGTKVDLAGKVALYIENKCYVPKQLLNEIGIVVDIIHEDEIAGTGTKSDPYLIQNTANFLTFTNNLLSGETYTGKYFKQTTNIDMSTVAGYTGLGENAMFDGIYDGQGHTIHVEISASEDAGISVFPYTSGTIINLGTTGNITNTASDNGCAGIVRSLRKNGIIVNCWSTVDLVSEKDAGGIAWTIKSGGVMQNCYYKGKITTTYNYGVGLAVSGCKISKSYYKMENGSSDIKGSDSNLPGGTQSDDFSSDTLNGLRKNAVENISTITSEEQLCKYVDMEGYDFFFEGNVARLQEFSYTYVAKDGTKITKIIPDFDRERTGYDVNIAEDIDITQPILLSGTAFATNGNELVKESEVKINEYGFATGEVRVSTNVKTEYYETVDTFAYSVNLVAPISENTTVAPIETPEVSKAPKTTQPPKPTNTVEASSTPEPTQIARVTNTPDAIESIEPNTTSIPDVTQTPKVEVTTSMPKPTNEVSNTSSPFPEATEVIQVTETPIVVQTSNPFQTESPKETISPQPTEEITKISITNCKISEIKKSYVYKHGAIKPTFVLKNETKTLKKNVDYKITYSKNVNVGTAKIVIKGIGNYNGKMSFTFRITAKSVSNLSVAKIKKQKYTGKVKKPNISIKQGIYKLKKGKDYTLVYKKNRNKGTAIVYIKGKGNYKGKKKVKFRIK